MNEADCLDHQHRRTGATAGDHNSLRGAYRASGLVPRALADVVRADEQSVSVEVQLGTLDAPKVRDLQSYDFHSCSSLSDRSVNKGVLAWRSPPRWCVPHAGRSHGDGRSTGRLPQPPVVHSRRASTSDQDSGATKSRCVPRHFRGYVRPVRIMPDVMRSMPTCHDRENAGSWRGSLQFCPRHPELTTRALQMANQKPHLSPSIYAFPPVTWPETS